MVEFYDDLIDEEMDNDDYERDDIEHSCVDCGSPSCCECDCCGMPMCHQCSEGSGNFCNSCLADPNFSNRMAEIFAEQGAG